MYNQYFQNNLKWVYVNFLYNENSYLDKIFEFFWFNNINKRKEKKKD